MGARSRFLVSHLHPLHCKHFFEKILPHELVAGGVRVEIIGQIFGQAFVKELETVYIIDVVVAAPFERFHSFRNLDPHLFQG